MNYVITIGRRFGSGGRLIGQKLAQRLGIEYYDKQLLVDAARSAGVSPELFEKRDERTPSFLSGILSFNMGMSPISLYAGSTPITDDSIYGAQAEFIRSIAAKSSCVIVGRTADYVLRDHPRCINVFISAPIDACCRRIIERTPGMTMAQAKALAEKTDKLRSNFYNFYTDKDWGDSSSYDLTIDSSRLPIDSIVDIIAGYASRRLSL